MRRWFIGLAALCGASCGCPDIGPSGLTIDDGTYRQRARTEGLNQAELDDSVLTIEGDRLVVEYTSAEGARVRVTYRIAERYPP